MKPPIRQVLFFSSLLFLFILNNLAFAENKTFIKEYSYLASEDDSRNSSRVIALREVKRLLLEELGTYLESETVVKNFQLTRDRITTLTAGIIQAKIVEEKWDGRIYWLKAKMVADSDKVVQTINELRKDREKVKELEAWKRKSDELMREVEQLRKELTAAGDGNRGARKVAYDKSIKKLSAVDWMEKAHNSTTGKEILEALNKAVELDPENVSYLYERASHYSESGKKTLALQDYGKIISLKPKDIDSYKLRGLAYDHLGKQDLALKELEELIKSTTAKEKRAEAYASRGDFYLDSLSRPDLAIKDYTKAIELEPKNTGWYISRAMAYEKEKVVRFDLVLKDYNKVIELEPGEAGNYIFRASFYYQQSKYELALADFNRAISLDPKNPYYYDRRGEFFRKRGNTDLALQDYARYIELNPTDSRGYWLRADIYKSHGKIDLALREYDKIIELYPKYTLYYMERATLYSANGKRDLALKDFDKCIELEPDSPFAYSWRARLMLDLNKPEEAIGDYGKAIERDWTIQGKADSLRYRGEVYEKLGKYDLAAQDYSMAVNLEPKNYYAFLFRSQFYYRIGKYDLALRDCDKVIILKTNSSDLYEDRIFRADLYSRLGKYDMAIKEYDNLIQLHPKYGSAYFARAKVYALRGMTPKAILDLKKAMELDPSRKTAARQEKQFDKIRNHPEFLRLIGPE
jgi:tetratricopeptide (TPR) repeat protein